MSSYIFILFLRCFPFRFLAICFPLKFQMTTRAARIIIACIWLYSLIVPIPWLLFFDLVPAIKGDDTLFCLEMWPDYLNGNIYFLVFNVMLGYLIPLVVISVCYIFIYIKVWKRDIPTDTKTEQMERLQHTSKIKVRTNTNLMRTKFKNHSLRNCYIYSTYY